ncbi:restriction endonuclease subunit S [Lactobacillus delbrueckii]|uniref:restriction endonuclease subunit S n=1 Tax=Lactobacillus delbrueckii TaxID=1584 RepID=UPI0022EBC1DD|nr:restriction endonuclease subunit S [Lactobacillus delbrueckii]MDA3784851.1 restriction endonuclease subunit S [Lactobacillus delbrueckii]MDA3796228.1 restriction endonuclease subunit S [Lactobacillus delbrueckii]
MFAWEQCKLGDVAKINSGKDYKGLQPGKIPVYGTGGYMLSVNDKLSDIDAIGIGRKGTIDKPYYLNAPFWTVDTLFYVTPRGTVDISFMFPLFKNINWKRYDESTGVPSLSKNTIKKIRVSFPQNNEQVKIGDLFQKITQIITLHEEKKRQLERLKSALMQKMFADKSGYPAVRFNGFCDEWKKQKLGDIVETITDYVAAGSFASLRENVIYRSEPCYAQLIRTADLKSNFSKIAPVYVDKQAFDFLYRVSLDKESVILPNIGNCGEVYYVDPHELPYMRNVLGPNAILIRSSSLNNHFLSILFQSHNFQKSLKLIISPNGQTKFNKTELKRIKMVLPMDVNEQNSLSAFFKMINTAISLQEHKSNILKELKSSLLQNMFI